MRPGGGPQSADELAGALALPAERRARGASAPTTRSADDADVPEVPTEDEPPEIQVLEEGSEDVAAWLALDGLPPNTRIAQNVGRAGPPDPVERGDATLTLALFDAVTGASLESDVVLWRLDAPANRFWKAGDQDVARERVGADGLRFEGLVPGRYRVVVLEERAAAPDPPVLEVVGDATVRQAVERPERRPVRLHLDSADARRPPVAAHEGQVQASDRSDSPPPWARLRSVQPEFDRYWFTDTSEFEIDSGEVSWEPLLLVDGAYDLHSLSEDTRGEHYWRRVWIRVGAEEPRSLRVEAPEPDPAPRAPLDVRLTLE